MCTAYAVYQCTIFAFDLGNHIRQLNASRAITVSAALDCSKQPFIGPFCISAVGCTGLLPGQKVVDFANELRLCGAIHITQTHLPDHRQYKRTERRHHMIPGIRRFARKQCVSRIMYILLNCHIAILDVGLPIMCKQQRRHAFDPRQQFLLRPPGCLLCSFAAAAHLVLGVGVFFCFPFDCSNVCRNHLCQGRLFRRALFKRCHNRRICVRGSRLRVDQLIDRILLPLLVACWADIKPLCPTHAIRVIF